MYVFRKIFVDSLVEVPIEIRNIQNGSLTQPISGRLSEDPLSKLSMYFSIGFSPRNAKYAHVAEKQLTGCQRGFGK